MTTVAKNSSWAILLCKWNDDLSEPVPLLCAESMFSTSGMGWNNMVDFFRLYSHGNLDLSESQVFGWFVLPQKKSQYAGSGANPAGRTDLVNWCIEAATAGGVNVNQFYGAVCCMNNPTDLCALYLGAPGRVICDPNNLNLSAVGQEMLHGYGVDHARQDGSTVDYQDPYDVMSVYTTNFEAKNEPNFPACKSLASNKEMGPGLNAALMDSKGWLDPDRVWTYSGARSGLSLRPHHRRDLLGALVAKVGQYYVEFRMNEGFDAGIPQPVVLVHRFDPDGHSYLMNATDGKPYLVAGSTFKASVGTSTVVVSVTNIDPVNRMAALSIAPQGDVQVPDLIGDSFAQARQIAQNLGLLLQPVGKGNVVVDQEPQAGATVPLGSTIRVTLSYEGKG